MLQCIPKKRRGGDNAKTSDTRARFLFMYEKSFGNISASCEYAQIARPTYYRWMKSKSRVNVRFQQKIAALQPAEKLIDYAEAALTKRIAQGDTTAIIFALKTKGKVRGYSEKSIEVSEQQIINETLEKVAHSFQMWLADNRDAADEEKSLWLERFARNGGVESKELARRVNVSVQEVSQVQ